MNKITTFIDIWVNRRQIWIDKYIWGKYFKYYITNNIIDKINLDSLILYINLTY